MKYRLLDLMVCPECNDFFAISVFSKKVNEDNKNELKKCKNYCGFNSKKLEISQFIDCNSCHKIDIEEGILICNTCKKWFPIIGSIPRIIPKVIEDYPEFFKKYMETLPKEFITKAQLKEFERLKKKTKESFGFQWTHYRHINKEVEKLIFLEKTGIEPPFLKNKLILDAGCGYGRYTYAAKEFGAEEIIAFDLSKAVESAFENTKMLSNVHIVQADIFYLPFRKEIFDFIFSIGVLHHTYSPKEAFMRLIPFLKNMGSISIWVYRKRHPLRMILNHLIRAITSRLPHRLLWYICWIAKPLGGFLLMLSQTKYIPIISKEQRVYRVTKYPLIHKILFGRIFFFISDKPDGNERWADTFDWWAPQYEHFHTMDEVIGWFKEANLKDITITSREDIKDDIGVRGVKIKADVL